MIYILLDGRLHDTPPLIDIVYQARNRNPNAPTQGRPVDDVEGFQCVDQFLFEKGHHFTIELNAL